jgi:hypothetical protein
MKKDIAGHFVKAYSEKDAYMKLLENVSTFTECPEVDKNVFTCLLSDKVVEADVAKSYSSKRSKELHDHTTGEVIKLKDRTIFYQKEYVDNDKYVKLYKDGFKNLFDLSHNAYKVFGYFVSEIQQDKDADLVHFSMQDCMKQCGYKTHPMVYRALTELILKEFICKSSKYKFAFYVNPINICNGSRIRFVKEIINMDSLEQLGDNESTTEIEKW